MNDIAVITCDAMVGLPRVPFDNGIRPDVADLLHELDRLRISAALVRHRASIENDPYYGNRTLLDEIAGQDRLRPVWALTPDGECPAFDHATAVRAMLAAGARAACLSPSKHLYSSAPWCCGDMYAVLEAARVPVLVSYDEIDGDRLDEICTAFPLLRLVLLRVPRLGREYANVFLDLSYSPCPRKLIEELAAAGLEDKLIWGSDAVFMDSGQQLGRVVFAQIATEQKAKILGLNAQRTLRPADEKEERISGCRMQNAI